MVTQNYKRSVLASAGFLDPLSYLSEAFSSRPQPALIVSAVSELKSLRVNRHIESYARERGVPYFLSLVEWFSFANFSGLGKHEWLRSSRYKNTALHEYFMRFEAPRHKNLLCISSYLADYYRSKGCAVLRVPTLIDLDDYPEEESVASPRDPDETVAIGYAGAPSRKDCAATSIRALLRLSASERSRLRLRFYGVDAPTLRAVGMTDETLALAGDSLTLFGRIPYEEVRRRIIACDFTVLLRRNNRNARAGFATKVGESFACGTPMIANLTSDMPLYLHEGRNALVCEDSSETSCAEAYRRALNLSFGERVAMRREAYETARASFDYRNYIAPLQDFISRLL